MSSLDDLKNSNLFRNYVVPFLLFALVAPGALLSIPPTVKANVDEKSSKEYQLFLSGRVTWYNLLVHAAVFTAVLLWVNYALGQLPEATFGKL